MIPKVMNFFWSGDKMSWLRHLSLITFKKFNPSWNIRLFLQTSKIKHIPWSDKAQQDFSTYSGINYLDKLHSEIEVVYWSDPKTADLDPVHQSDIFRWKLLSEAGGFYADTDILFIRPFNLYDRLVRTDLVTCFYDGYFSIGFLGGSPNNCFYADVLKRAETLLSAESYESAGIPVIHRLIGADLKSNSDTVLLSKLKKKYHQLKVFHCPKTTVYPFSLKQTFESVFLDVPQETIGIHWFAGYPQSQLFNNKFDAANIDQSNCLIAEYIKRIL